MNKEVLLNSLSKKRQIPEEEGLFKKCYRSEMITAIERDGIFFSLFNKMFDQFHTRLPHFLLSRFDLFSNEEVFYLLSCRKNAKGKSDKSLLLFHLDPLTVPLMALEDFLQWYKNKRHFKKTCAHFSFNLDLGNGEHQKYLHAFYSLIVFHLGYLPEAMTLLDLEKAPGLHDLTVLEAGTLWNCLDNYIVHLVLSKGGHYILPGLPEMEYEVLEREELSFYHEIQKVRLKKETRESDLACPFAEDLLRRNFFKNPQDLHGLIYLMYQNILDQGEVLTDRAP